MKTLTQFKTGETNISLVSLVEDKGKKQLWFSSKTKGSFENDIAEIRTFLDLAREHPGKRPCNFIFEHRSDKNGYHLIFIDDLFTALSFLKGVGLESVQPAIKVIIGALQDPDEPEIQAAMLETQKLSKQTKNEKLHHPTKKKSEEKTPLLTKNKQPVFVK